MKRDPRLVGLYKKIAAHTVPECGRCRVPHGCCDVMYCEMAREFAKEQGVELKDTGFKNQKVLPFLGPEGCVVPPHLRPVCSVHVCCINSLGLKPGDKKWTKEYFRLRGRIEEMEYLDGLVDGD